MTARNSKPCLSHSVVGLSLWALLVMMPAGRLNAATVLPVGPITFASNSDYDNNFKEPNPSFAAMSRDPGGYLSLINAPSGIAVYDTSVTPPPVGGAGGTAGSNTNNDLADFAVSADLSTSQLGIDAGFFLRLNNAGTSSYLAAVHNFNPFTIEFDLLKGSSIAAPGATIFHQVIPLPPSMSIVANVFYPFQVTANGSTFTFDFGNGLAHAVFTDPNPSFPVGPAGQVGFLLNNLGPGVARLDNFQINAVPEPSSLLLAALAGIVPFVLQRRNAWRA